MKENIVILLGHKKRVGKDTVANYLKSNYNFQIISFAQKLKEIVQDLYDFSDEQINGDLKDEQDTRYPNNYDLKECLDDYWSKHIDDVDMAIANGVSLKSMMTPNSEYKEYFTPRRLLQIVGQQQRALYPDIWAKYVFDQINFSGGRFVIPDFRFENEYDVAKTWNIFTGGELITVRIDRDCVFDNTKDVSENALNSFDRWDHIISNNTTTQSLYNEVDRLMNEIL